MFYYVIWYSFDGDKPVSGPYSTFEECWQAMKENAQKEYTHDTEVMGYNTEMTEMEDAGEIKLVNYFSDRNDETVWMAVEIPK